jgi:hypothetical protein
MTSTLRVLAGAFCAAAALTLIPTQADAAAKQSKAAENLKLARDYALVACLMHRYKDTELAAEVNVWASGLVERGSVPGDFYGKLSEYVRSAAPEPGTSKAGATMRMKSCIDFYNDPALTVHIQKLLKRR